jgi:hypothetical protein
MRDRKVGVWALMDYQIPSDETLLGAEKDIGYYYIFTERPAPTR